jgi:hypothetical protein
MDRAPQSRRAAAAVRRLTRTREEICTRTSRVRASPPYLAAPVAAPVAVAAAYFLRNLSTRPAVSTIFCLPV